MSTLASPPPISPLGVSLSAYKYPNPILFCTSHSFTLHVGSSVLAIRSYSSQACGSLMSEGKHHHLFHHHKEEDQAVDDSGACVEETHDYEKEMKHHKHKEHLGELGAVAAGAFALHEKHKAKKDPENAHKHKIQEEIAATLAVGAGGFALHERHEKKDAKEEKKAEEGHHHRHF